MWLLVCHDGNRTEMVNIIIKEKQQHVLIRSLGSMLRGMSLNPDFLISEQGDIMPCLLGLGFFCICNTRMIMLLDSLSLIIMWEEYSTDITALYLTDCPLDNDILGADKNFQCYYFISCHLPLSTTVLDFSRSRVFVPFKLRSFSAKYYSLCIIDIDRCELLSKISNMHIFACVLRFIFSLCIHVHMCMQVHIHTWVCAHMSVLGVGAHDCRCLRRPED